MAKILTVAALGIAGLAAFKGVAVYETVSSVFVQPAYAAMEESGAAAGEPDAAGDVVVDASMMGAPDLLPELLVALQAERDELSRWRDQLGQKEAEIALAQSTLDAKAEELEALKIELDRLLDRTARENTADVELLVNIYKAMKPGQAAAIMNEADIEVSVLVLSAMEPRNSGPVIALMEPVRARAISKIILERSRLPGDQKLSNVKLN